MASYRYADSGTATEDRIAIYPEICHGKPVIRDTRVPVGLVVGSLTSGMSFEDVQREYDLSIEDTRAALKFAGDLFQQESFHPITTARRRVRFLIDANLPRSAVLLLTNLGRSAEHVRDGGCKPRRMSGLRCMRENSALSSWSGISASPMFERFRRIDAGNYCLAPSDDAIVSRFP